MITADTILTAAREANVRHPELVKAAKQVRKHQASIRTMQRNLRLGHYQGRNGGGDTTYLERRVAELMADLPRGLQGDLRTEHGLALRISENRDQGIDRPELRARLAGVRRAIKRELEVL